MSTACSASRARPPRRPSLSCFLRPRGLLLCAPLCALLGALSPHAPAATAPHATLRLSADATLTCGVARAHRTPCHLHAHAAAAHALALHVPETVAPGSLPQLRLLAATPAALLLVDTYPSQPLGLAQCQSGSESFLRLLALRATGPALSETLPLESCRKNLSLALDGLTWNAATGTLHLRWLTPPPGSPAERTLHLNAAGELTR